MKISDIRDDISQLIEQQQLPQDYWQLVESYIEPLSRQIAREHQKLNKTMVVAINGGQGSGKSTFSLFLKLLLQSSQQCSVVAVSQDDFYLGKSQRQQIAKDIHPLLATRGVPGTHDVALALQTLKDLIEGKAVPLPQFDKALDDGVPVNQWPLQQEPVDIILLEGWCVGALPQSFEQLKQPINELEKNEDSLSLWRGYVNQCLAENYQQWFGLIDYLVMLKVPDMASVYQWRSLQEKKLQQNYCSDQPNDIMDQQHLMRFIQHFERLTLHQLHTLPERADVVFYLNQQHGIDSASGLVNGLVNGLVDE